MACGDLDQGWQMFSVKGQMVNTLGISPCGFGCIHSTFPLECQRGHRQHVSGRVWLGSSRALFTKANCRLDLVHVLQFANSWSWPSTSIGHHDSPTVMTVCRQDLERESDLWQRVRERFWEIQGFAIPLKSRGKFNNKQKWRSSSLSQAPSH